VRKCEGQAIPIVCPFVICIPFSFVKMIKKCNIISIHNMDNIIKKAIEEHEAAIVSVKKNTQKIKEVANLLKKTIKNGGHIFVCGNGGSSADSQHIVGELRGHFEKERKPIRATALTVDTSSITAIGNDYGFKYIFSRQLEALSKKDDILIAISTSGNSENVLMAIKKARNLGVKTVALTGKGGGKILKFVNYTLCVDSKRVSRIQEVHELMFHILCELIDEDIKKIKNENNRNHTRT